MVFNQNHRVDNEKLKFFEDDNGDVNVYAHGTTKGVASAMLQSSVLNATTSATSESLDTRDFVKGVVYLYVESSGTPTDVVIELQKSPDDDEFYPYYEEKWADLRFEDSNTSDGLKRSWVTELPGSYTRFKITGTGTDGDNTFTVSATLQPYE